MEEVSADQGLTMAPRNSGNNTEPSTTNPDCEQEQDAEEDIHEIAAVNDSLDKLNNFLDAMEQRNADIRAQLIELLHSNREIRESFKAENETK